MSTNFYEMDPRKLHSPLLHSNKNNIKGKRTYYSPKQENETNSIDHTLDSTIFNNKERLMILAEQNYINEKAINKLEATFKIASIFILASGGIFCILEFSNIARDVYNGNYNFGNSLTLFICVLIGTVLANVICMGFLHLVKTTKYIYLNIENQKEKIDKLLTCFFN